MILYMLSKVFTSYTSYASDNIFEEELNLLIDIDSIEELYFIVCPIPWWGLERHTLS